jgi:hypothetical protein
MPSGRVSGKIPEDSARCAKIKRDDQRCKNPHLPGTAYCYPHTPPPNRKRAAEKATDIRIREEMLRFAIEPVEDSPEMTGQRQLSYELRRSVAWIRFCEAQLQKLPDERAFIYGVTSLETASESESGDTGEGKGGSGKRDITKSRTRVVESAAPHGWVVRLEWNRAQLTRLCKIWIDAGFEQARLELEIATVDRFFTAINTIVSGLGHDVDDPKVIEVITASIERVQELPTLPAA